MQQGNDWGGDYSRFTFNHLKNYFYMLKEQGVPVLDDEFNLLQEISLTFLRRLTQDTVGDGTPNGCFNITDNNEAQNDFIIRGFDNSTADPPGRFYIGGYMLVLDSDTTFLAQPITQPAITVPFAARLDQVYLEVYFAEISSLVDAEIKDPVLNQDTSRRLKLQWEVKVAEGSTMPGSYLDLNGIQHTTLRIGYLTWVNGALSIAGNGWTSQDHSLEIIHRADFDELQTSVNSEIISRQDGDTALNARVDNEVNNRTNTDNVLNSKIDAKSGGLNTKVIDIGPWDMSSISGRFLPHGVNLSKIRNISALISIDSGDFYLDFLMNISGYSGSTPFWQMYASQTSVHLRRQIGGLFDHPDYSSVLINRGWITIQYVD